MSEKKLCKCAELDWSGVDQTLEHHPKCAFTLNASTLEAGIPWIFLKSVTLPENFNPQPGELIPVAFGLDYLCLHLKSLHLQPGSIVVTDDQNILAALQNTESPVEDVTLVYAQNGLDSVYLADPDQYVDLPNGCLLRDCPFESQEEIERAKREGLSLYARIVQCVAISPKDLHQSRYKGFYVLHPHCGARGPVCDTAEEAVQAWNRR